MSATTVSPPAESASAPTPERYPARRLMAGVAGRAWLWFLAGCLLVTVVPLLFGWHAYLVESASMAPRIRVGDVVLASPEQDPQRLLGHVTVFDDPDFPGRVKTHRVVAVNPDGTFVTKGDANVTPDSAPVALPAVHGLGRLLVKWVGLPVIWLQQRNALPLALFVLSVVLAGLAVSRDQEETAEQPQEPADPGEPEVSDPWATTASQPPDGSTVVARVAGEGFGMGQRLRYAAVRLLPRLALCAALATLLTIPMTFGAFAATTNNSSELWSVPNWDYTTQLKALGPKIYYKLDDASPSASATDSSGNAYTGTYNGTTTNFTYGVTGALVTDSPNLAVTQKTANACIFTPAASSQAAPGPATYSEIVWFKTASGYSLGGKLVGLENQRTTTVSTQYDRHIYMDGNGRLYFGVWLTTPGTAKTINTAASYNDGGWHMAVATMGAAGMRLYVDGVLQASDANTTSETFSGTGYWRFGCGNLSGWGGAANWSGPNAPSASQNYALQGSLDEVSVFLTQLSASDIAFLYWIR